MRAYRAGGLALVVLAGVGPFALAAAAEPQALSTQQIVLDIMSFTRWPGPHPTLRLCVVGQPDHADEFAALDLRAGEAPVQVQRLATTDDRLGAACDAVYEGPLTPAERDQVGRRIAGHPVLTVGEPAPGCIESTMFCLQSTGTQVGFASNLDAIARSGVRLNPRVLLLGRRAPAVR